MNKAAPVEVDHSALPFNYIQRGQDWVEGSNAHEQSPIDINTEQAIAANENMKFELFLNEQELKNLVVLDTINSIQVVGPFSKLYGMDVDGQTYEYEAVQFHFHAPSEHTINDGHYDLEMHIVHQITPDCFARTNTKRNLAVVGIFFQVDESAEIKDHPFLTVLEAPASGEEFSMNFNDVFKNDLKDMMTYYAYKGSLTVPPCSANANWFVIEKPIKITRHQQEYFDFRWKDNPFYAHGHGNNRPVQPLAGRTVLKSSNCCIKGADHEHERKLYLEKPPLPEDKANKSPEKTQSPQRMARAVSVYSNDSGSVHSKEVPRELLTLGNIYQRARSSKSLHSKEVPKELQALLESEKGLARFGSVHARIGGTDTKKGSVEGLKRGDSSHTAERKSDSVNSKGSDRPVIRESLYSKGTSTRQESVYHVDEIPLELLMFGSCFPTDDTPVSRASHHSKGFGYEADEAHFLDHNMGSPEQGRSGQTLYSKEAPAELAELLKAGLKLDDEDEK